MVPMINEVDNVTELPLAKRREVRRPPRTRERVRMSGQERREQLLDVGAISWSL